MLQAVALAAHIIPHPANAHCAASLRQACGALGAFAPLQPALAIPLGASFLGHVCRHTADALRLVPLSDHPSHRNVLPALPPLPLPAAQHQVQLPQRLQGNSHASGRPIVSIQPPDGCCARPNSSLAARVLRLPHLGSRSGSLRALQLCRCPDQRGAGGLVAPGRAVGGAPAAAPCLLQVPF